MLETPGIATLAGRLSDGIGLFRTIKKPACGRLLGGWLGLFLVNRTSLQNVHPALAAGCGTGGKSSASSGDLVTNWKCRCAKVGRSIRIFFGNSQCEARSRGFGSIHGARYLLSDVWRRRQGLNCPISSPTNRPHGIWAGAVTCLILE